MNREAAVIIMRTVFDVAKSAIKDRITPAFVPNTDFATSASGSGDSPSSCQGTTLTTDIATRTYIIVVIINEYIIAFGMFFLGFNTSSPKLARFSKPR